MMIINGMRNGKTETLIEHSAKEGTRILVKTEAMRQCIVRQADCMGLSIPYPVTVDELKGEK